MNYNLKIKKIHLTVLWEVPKFYRNKGLCQPEIYEVKYMKISSTAGEEL